MNKFVIMFLSAICLSVHYGSAQARKPFTFHGKIDSTENALYYFHYQDHGSSIVDSAYLGKDGSFKISGQLSEPSRLFIAIKDKYDPRIVGPFSVYQTWLEPGKDIRFHGFKDWKKGIKNFQIWNSSIDSLSRAHLEGIKHMDQAAEEKYDKDFILSNTDNYYALFAMRALVSSAQVDLNYLKSTLPKFKANFQQTNLYQEIASRLEVAEKTAVGMKFPDFQLPNEQGHLVKLSDIQKGKYILIDLWASWCGPCRKENPNLQKTYERFKDKGFDIVGISVDMLKDDWLKAIEEDGLPWTQLSDLKGWKDGFAKSLYIHAVPDSFLLSPEGTIIARGARVGLLEELLEKHML